MTQKERSERLSIGAEVAVLNGVSFTSYDRTLFYDVGFRVHKGEIVTIVGESGSGKSVLLQLIAGRLLPDEGQIRTFGSTVTFVPQNIEEFDVDRNSTIRDYYYSARNLSSIATRKLELETAMALNSNNARYVKEYGEVMDAYERAGGYTADSDIEHILEGLEISKRRSGHIELDTTISEVSSGQHTRLLLGRSLFSTSDLLVLDDPTRHLDTNSISWLADFLRNRDQGVVLATQNVMFAEKCANRIVEITDFGRVLTFQGKYSEYANKRDAILEAEKKVAEVAKERYEKLNATFLKFKNAGYFRRSKDFAQVGSAMQSRLGRMRDELDSMPGTQDTYRKEKVKDHEFIQSNEQINPSVAVRHVRKSYDGKYMAVDLKRLDLTVRRGQVLAITGSNGSGKSTLMRMIEDVASERHKFGADTGEIYLEKGLVVGYNAPDFLNIPAEGNIFDVVLSELPRRNEAVATGILLFFGFSNQDLRNRKIETISGGEKKQLALAMIMAKQPDILFLDEPTDNLKSEVVSRLAGAIRKYKGTTFVISHDSEFIKMLDIDMELKLPGGELIIRKHKR